MNNSQQLAESGFELSLVFSKPLCFTESPMNFLENYLVKKTKINTKEFWKDWVVHSDSTYKHQRNWKYKDFLELQGISCTDCLIIVFNKKKVHI